MVFGIIGIFVALGFLFFLVFKGWSTTIATVLATIVVCIFTWTNPVPALVDTYSSGVGSSAINFFLLFGLSGIYAEIINASGAGAAFARTLVKICGRNAAVYVWRSCHPDGGLRRRQSLHRGVHHVSHHTDRISGGQSAAASDSGRHLYGIGRLCTGLSSFYSIRHQCGRLRRYGRRSGGSACDRHRDIGTGRSDVFLLSAESVEKSQSQRRNLYPQPQRRRCPGCM